MKVLRAASSLLLSSLLIQAEDFNLRFLGDGPINLHTQVTFEDGGERLIATATNGSEIPIQQAKICIASQSLKKGCLFELWNTEIWGPGKELSWNVMSKAKVTNLLHDAMIEEYTSIKPPENAAAPKAPSSPIKAPTPLVSQPVPTIQYSATTTERAGALIQDGTPIRMRLAQNLSSATAQIGDSVSFEVLDDIAVGNNVVIAGGAIALATVTSSQEKRSMGRAGHLDITLDYVRGVSGEKIRVRGVQDTKGGGHTGAMTGAMVATAVVFWPAAPLFLFMKGKDVKIPKGHEVTVFVDGDQHIAPRFPPAGSRADPESTPPPAPRPSPSGKPMTNDDVLALKSAGFGDDFIISKIKSSGAAYNLDTTDLVKLKQSGLSEAVISAMVHSRTPEN